MKLKSKAERRRKRRTKGGDFKSVICKKGVLALGGISKGAETTWNPVAGTQHGGAVELFLSSRERQRRRLRQGCLTRHMRGLKALVATRNGVGGGARARCGTHWWPELAREVLENVASLDVVHFSVLREHE